MPTALQDLRRTRRTRRLGELEWFEIAYRVYLSAIVGGAIVLWLTGLVDDVPVSAAEIAEVLDRGPAIVGLVAAVAIAVGIRSGSDGGPVSIEAADVRHVLLAPVPRRAVLLRPVAQRLRAVAFAGAVAGGIGGLLAARRLPGSPAAWITSGAIDGALVGAAFVAAAVVVHVGRVPRPLATAIAVVILGWQLAAAADLVPGPLDALGGLALWGMRQHPVELVAAVAVAAAVTAALATCGRLRVEPLVRRADLVSQLHFAVAVQDLRTVVLLRRQLRGEHARTRPWVRLPRGRTTRRGAGTFDVVRRGLTGLARSPVAQLARMAGLAITAGVAALAVLAGTTPAIVVIGGALFLLGLDAVEPLSQEIDHPDRTDALPVDRGWLLARHLAAPGALLVPFALLGAAVVAIGRPSDAAAAFALAIPVTWAGASGAVISVVRGAPDPVGTSIGSAIPPEFAGFKESFRLVLPVVVSTLAGLVVLAAREVPEPGTVVRSAVGLGMLVALVVWWVRRYDHYRAAWRRFLEAGRMG